MSEMEDELIHLGATTAGAGTLNTASRKVSDSPGQYVTTARQPSTTRTNGSRCATILSSEMRATVQAANRLTPNGGVIMPSARLTTMIVPKCTGSTPKCRAT